jgi:hypothetical protein
MGIKLTSVGYVKIGCYKKDRSSLSSSLNIRLPTILQDRLLVRNYTSSPSTSVPEQMFEGISSTGVQMTSSKR